MRGTKTVKTGERLSQARRNVHDHIAGRHCPICGQAQWQTDPALGICGYADYSTITPVVPVVCTHCGYTALINALIATKNN